MHVLVFFARVRAMFARDAQRAWLTLSARSYRGGAGRA